MHGDFWEKNFGLKFYMYFSLIPIELIRDRIQTRVTTSMVKSVVFEGLVATFETLFREKGDWERRVTE